MCVLKQHKAGGVVEGVAGSFPGWHTDQPLVELILPTAVYTKGKHKIRLTRCGQIRAAMSSLMLKSLVYILAGTTYTILTAVLTKGLLSASSSRSCIPGMCVCCAITRAFTGGLVVRATHRQGVSAGNSTDYCCTLPYVA